ncbi:MAG: PQQ-binding-like beta-propeller repeat protein [Bacteroidota bacterium]
MPGLAKTAIFFFCLPLLFFSCSKPEPKTPLGANADWAHYLGHPSSNQYSLLKQINKENLDKLTVAWTYDTGDSANYQVNNLIIDGVLFTATPHSRIIALNAAKGDEIWVFDPDEIKGELSDHDQRGVAYWKDGDKGRILTSKGPWLFMLDAKTGELVESFAENGAMHLGENMDLEKRGDVYLNTPGHIYQDMLIMGTNVGEDTPGAVRAFDLRTGERKWIFHTFPREGEFGSDTWPEDYIESSGGASDWSGLAIDTARGIVYSSTETAGPDFFGGRRYGENLFANSLVALDANTGERLWHFQFVHHDMWDMDCPTPPTLLTVMHKGKMLDVVAQGTKMGLLYVFDRVSGEPLWPIEERETAPSEIAEIKAWPTQPYPSAPPPLTRQLYTEADYSNISPKAAQLSKDVYERGGSQGSFPGPSLEQSIIFPGFDGGFEWGGSAADPDGILYVNVNEMPWYYQLIPTKTDNAESMQAGEALYRGNCSSCHGINRLGDPGGGFPALDKVSSKLDRKAVMALINYGGGRMPAFKQLSDERKNMIVDYLFGKDTPELPPNAQLDPYVFAGFKRFLDDEGYPAIKPPWGTLNAVDLNTGTIKWKVPLGEFEELTERGIPITGTENYGGPVVTASGLIFIAATTDKKIRAFDTETGDMLWQHDLPFDGHSTPSTYMADGKQYVVVSAGNSKLNPVKGGMLVAFAIEE